MIYEGTMGFHFSLFIILTKDGMNVGMGPPVRVGIGSLPVTPEINGEIGAVSAESDLAGIGTHNKPCDGLNE